MLTITTVWKRCTITILCSYGVLTNLLWSVSVRKIGKHVCVCVCVCVCVSMPVRCIVVTPDTCINPHTSINKYERTHSHNTYTHTRTQSLTSSHTHMYTQTKIRTYTHIHTHTYTHTHTHIHTHGYTYIYLPHSHIIAPWVPCTGIASARRVWHKLFQNLRMRV